MPITKKRLQSYIGLRLENENINERIARMQSAAEMPPMSSGDGSQHTGSSGDRMARAVERLIEYKAQVAPTLESNRKEMLEIENAVNCLDDPIEREVMQMRYIDQWFDPETGFATCRWTPWSEIAHSIYGNGYERGVKAVLKVHRSALAFLETLGQTGSKRE